MRTAIMNPRNGAAWAACILMLGPIFGCGEDEGPALELSDTFDASSECESGSGQRLVVGLDDNRNGELEADEIDREELLCDGPQGPRGGRGSSALEPLVHTNVEPAGDNCIAGGTRVDVGFDTSGDGRLDSSEITTTAYICDGDPGARAPAYLVETSTVVDGQCPNTGTEVRRGLDADGSGELEPGEVADAQVICDGADGLLTLISVIPESPGLNCTAGGRRVQTGLDENRNGLLDRDEVGDTDYLCDPAQALTEVSELPIGAAECPETGRRIDTGLDLNGDGVLEASEIVDTSVVCDGVDGTLTLVARTPVAPGDDCEAGGERIATGLDDDGDGTLSTGEENTVTFACNGVDGADGTTGSLVRVNNEPAGPNCPSGGIAIESGVDADASGSLDASEVSATRYVCDVTADVARVAVDDEPPGPNCTNGGRRIRAGLDSDGSGSLETSEILSTTFACNRLASVPIRITTSDLGSAVLNSPFNGEITAVGGIGGNFTWEAVTSLPAGLNLNTAGTPSTFLSGTPVQNGLFTFTVRVSDFFGNTDEADIDLRVEQPVTFDDTLLPRLIAGTPYSGTLTAVGGQGPYSFRVVSGTLPSALSLSANGVISGTPSGSTGARLIVEVEDSQGDTARAGILIRGEQNWAMYCGDYRDSGRDDLSLVSISGGTITSTGTILTTTDGSGSLVDVDCFDVAFSPTRPQAAYITGESEARLILVDFSTATNPQTFVVNGSLVSGGDVQGFRFSDDGAFIAYVADERVDEEDELFVVDLGPVPTGSPGRPIVANGPLVTFGDVGGGFFSDGEFQWAPGTHKVLYVADELTASQDELFIFDADNPQLGSQRVNQGLFSSTAADVDTDSWRLSPDGQWVAYVADVVSTSATDAFLVDISGTSPGTPVVLNDLARAGDVGTTSGDLGFSPNGQWVHYIASEGDPGDRLYLKDLTNLSATSQLASFDVGSTTQDVDNAVWSPDGRRVAFRGNVRDSGFDELFFADTQLVGSPVRLNPTLVSGGNVNTISSDDFDWSPDGAFLVYLADQDVDNSIEPYLVSVDDPESATRLSGTGLGDDTFSVRFASDAEAILYVGEETGTSGSSLVYVDFNPSTGAVSPKVVINNPTGTTDDVSSSDIRFIDSSAGVLYISAENQGGSDEEALFRTLGTMVGTSFRLNPPLPTSGDVFEVFVQEE